MDQLTDTLANYIAVLADSLNKTSQPEDRSSYVRHLSEAAILFSLLHRGASFERLEENIKSEQRNFGWSYLSGSEGEAAETAFAELVNVFAHEKSERDSE